MKKVLRLLIPIFVLVMSFAHVDAAENTLSGVDVKKGANSYTIELVTNEPTKMTKTIISSNRVLVTLNNIKVSNNLSTKYAQNAAIDNVIVEPQGANGASIMLQGDNIAYSDVTFKEPTSLKQMQDNMIDSVSAVASLGSSVGQNKAIPCAFLLFLVGIAAYEIRFIKKKYKELNEEKSLLEKDIERTSEFKDYMKGYGAQGITKPYTTPVYTNPNDSSMVRANYLQRLRSLKTSETTTLNSLLKNDNQETQIINKIVNNKPVVFGSLSNIMTENKEMTAKTTPVTTPVSHAKLKSQLSHLETLSKLYKQTAETEETFQNRLNGLY